MCFSMHRENRIDLLELAFLHEETTPHSEIGIIAWHSNAQQQPFESPNYNHFLKNKKEQQEPSRCP